jgi:hypothetical protein
MVKELTEEQIKWCDRNLLTLSSSKVTWILNDKGQIDVNVSIDLEYKNFKNFPVEFGEIKGNFWCSYNPSLTSLQGAPHTLSGSFVCIDCPSLISLEGLPEWVGGTFRCEHCPLLPQWTHDLAEEYNARKITYKVFRETYLKLLGRPSLQQGKNLGLW